MVATREAMSAGWRISRQLNVRAEADPIRWIRWLPAQDRYLRNRAQRRLLRAGNQAIGKTTVALADLYLDATGQHPHRPCDEPGEYWVICASWSQSIAIQGKLRALIADERLHPETIYTPIRGFRGKNPAVEVRHNNGGYSIIRFKTTQQGSLNLAGATIRGALFDEPPASQAIYSEVVKRVQATGGWVAIAMTPVGAPVDWIRQEAEENRIEDIHVTLTPDQLIPIGSKHPRRLPDGTPCDGEWIANVIAMTPAHEVPVRVHGDWEMKTTDAYFSSVFRASGPTAHVGAPPDGDFVFALGIDHGSRPGKQTAILVAIEERWPGGHPFYYVVDQYTDPTGTSTPEDDARGILQMLASNGVRWGDPDFRFCYGDVVHMKGTGKQKSNKDLAAQISKQLKTPMDALRPQIRTVKRGAGHGGARAGRDGSKGVGLKHLYHAMARGTFGVSPRCARLIEGFGRYDLRDDDHGWSDSIDALRYALDSYIFGTWLRGGHVRELRTR